MMFINCKNVEIIDTILKFSSFILIVIIIVTLLIKLYNNKNQINKNNLYNILLTKLIYCVIILIIPLIIKDIIINPTITKCIEDKKIEENQKEKEINNKKNAESIKKDIQALRTNLSLGTYEKIKTKIDNIDNNTIKEELLNSLKSIEEYVNMYNTIESLKVKYNLEQYYNAFQAIEKITENDIKNQLYTNIISLGKGKPLNLPHELTTFSQGNITYYQGVPLHPIENMPLIVIMQPYDCHKDLWQNTSKYTNEEFFFLTSNVGAYNDDMLKSFKNIIDSTVSKYRINRNKIIISGHSNGALSTLKLVSFFPNYFSAAVPISSTLPNFRGSDYKKTAFWGICGSGEACPKTMEEYADSVNRSGGIGKHSTVRGGHGDTACTFLNKEILEWALSQEIK